MTTTAPAEKAKAKRRLQGEGSVSKRKDGSYQASFELPIGRDGKRRRKYVYGKTKAEVVRKLTTEKAELQKRGDLTTSHPTVGQWADRYMRDIFQGRPGSIRNYANAIENYIKPFLGNTKLDKLTADDVLAFHRWMREEKGISGTTQGTMHSILRTIVNSAVKHDKVYRNVVQYVAAPKSDTKKFTAWNVEEAKRFLQYLDDNKVPNAARYVFALLTGARAGETLGLQWKDVDWENGTVHIRQQLQRITQSHGCNPGSTPTCGYVQAAKCPKAYFDAPAYWQHTKLTPTAYLAPVKTAAGVRVIPMVPALRSVLLWHFEQTRNDPNPHGLVFTKPRRKWGSNDPRPENRLNWREQVEPEQRYYPLTGEPLELTVDGKSWRDLAAAAGVPPMRRHDARHTAITLLLDMHVSPVVVQQIVGHSTIDMTESYRIASLPPAFEALMKLSAIVPESMLSEAGLAPAPDAPAALTA